MRRWAAIGLLFCTGCTNAPLAGFLDLARPSRARLNSDRPYDDGLQPQAPSAPAPGGQLLPPQFTPPGPLDPTPGTTPNAPAARIGPLALPNT